MLVSFLAVAGIKSYLNLKATPLPKCFALNMGDLMG